jgi:hypothetical protein
MVSEFLYGLPRSRQYLEIMEDRMRGKEQLPGSEATSSVDQLFANDVFASLTTSIRLDAEEPFHKPFVPSDSG